MSIVMSRQINYLLKEGAKNCLKCVSALRFNSSSNSDSFKVPGEIEVAELNKFNEPFEIRSVKTPKIKKPDEVLIDVNYCALNGPDILVSENLYSFKPSLPFIPGYEVCGKIVDVGKDAKEAGYTVGDKVVALNKERFGGLAELCISEIGDVWKIPTTIKSIDGVCLMEYYMTALLGLENYGSIMEDDMVLVNVGIGGYGLAAVDIAANIYRAKVIGVGYSEDRADKIRERGAYHAFTYKEKKLLSEIEEIAKERDIKDIFKDESGEQFKKVLKSFMDIYQSKVPSKELLRDDNFGVVVQQLSREGRIIVTGVMDISNNEDEDLDNDKFNVKGISLKDYRKRKHSLYRQIGEDVISFFEEGLIKPSPSMIAGFKNVNKAFKFISEMKSIGKVVIDIKNKEAEAKVNI